MKLSLKQLYTILAVSTGLWLSTATAESIDLRQIMADPAWMGNPVEQAWWTSDGQSVIYRQRRDDTALEDWYRVDIVSGDIQQLAAGERAEADAPTRQLFGAEGPVLFVRDGNLFVRPALAAAPRQLTRGGEPVQQASFSSDGQAVIYRRGQRWFVHDIQTGLASLAADLRFEADPDEPPSDALAQTQLRLFDSLRDDRERAESTRAEERRLAAEDQTRGPAPWFLGRQHRPLASSLSPDGRWLLLAVQPAAFDAGRGGRMPHYVTEDGYIDVEDVRTRVGRNGPAPQSLWLLDLENRERHELSMDELDGIQTDPLADLRAAQDLPALGDGENRPVSVIGLRWHPSGHRAAVQIRANDNKDRWIAVVDPTDPGLNQRHRLTDEAWINWAFNEFDWVPGSDDLWFLSEQSGYSHLYITPADRGRTRQLTSGDFEVMDIHFRLDRPEVLMLSNRSHPSEYDLYRLSLNDGELERISSQRGIHDFDVLPGGQQAVVRFSAAYLPPQLGLLDLDSGELRELTDTRSEQFAGIDWQMPEIVAVESSDGAGPIWSKFYPARTEAPEGGHPVVLFVHGAGYLQNTLHRYPQYFREQMFHNLLTERGYHVLDMDFRASRGYGREWRTAIYRQMGTPELQDLIDGVDWLVSEYGANPERVGVYGGSYGGFMAFMAMFNAPDRFQAGAALRPVTDWMHYNHPYTSNILNTPEIDPEAYLRSSPIEFADGLEGHLLMTHGVLDDNVFYQDVVRLSQRLIDLEKENWELASYPLERHGFQRPSSWLDQYRRILKLFETTIGGND